MLQVVLLCVLVTAISGQVVEDVLCGGRTWEPSCTGGANIRILAASFGKTDAICGGNDTEPWTVNCAVDVAEILRGMCGGKPQCSVPVEGRDACPGSSKFLQVIWGCTSGIPQNKIGNKNINIVVSGTPTRANPTPLHGQTVKGVNLYVFVDPSDGLLEVRWFLDQGSTVITIASTAPYEFYPGASWDTTTLPDGIHRVLALLLFTDGTSGSVDATVTVNNGQPQVAARATAKASDSFVESGTVTQTQPTVPTAVPWSLFGVSVAVAVVLLGIVIVKGRAA